MARKHRGSAKPARVAGAKAQSPKLDAQAWIDAAMETLADGGVDAVRVEPLAAALDVTKGSFYWHFADRRALLDALFAQWAAGRIAAIRDQVSSHEPPRMMLTRLADLYTRHANVKGLAIELAIRSFARTDDGAAKLVRLVDTERLTHVTRLFGSLGWGLVEAQARAILFYSYLFGQSLLEADIATPSVNTLALDVLLAEPPVSPARPDVA
ncbi:MAG TPA: helix-turn-helix domain-containing protein [Pseudorhodoplanes sp.]|nr:helix-turn-helix domain-containing protein [Pseudorhodoplanes sp.]